MKITKEGIKQARELASKFGLKRLWMNEKSEFFSNENHCANSVGGIKDKYLEVPLNAVVDVQPATNDLAMVKEVVEQIEAATEAATVEAILKAEKEGKNRKTVIDEAEKKLVLLTAKDAK